jgi:imidazolonepropionase
MQVDLILTNIGQLATCSNGVGPRRGPALRDVGIISDAAIAIDEGRFVAVGPRVDVENSFTAPETIDCGGAAVCPGFVDPHTHLVFAGSRLDEFELKIQGSDYLDILAKGGGIISTVRSTRVASESELVRLSIPRLDRMLAAGTTTCEIKTGYGLDTETELKMLRVIAQLDLEHAIDIVPTFLAAHAVPPEFKERGDDYVNLICSEMLPAAWEWYEGSHLQRSRRPFFCDVFTERGAFDLQQSELILKKARDLGFRLKAHVDEFTNLGGARLAIGLGAVSVDHLDMMSEEEVAILARSETVGISTPTVNFSFGSSDFADARRLIDSGCAIALSTDFNPGSAPCPSPSMAMAIACRYQKLLPGEALNAVTLNAAHAIGMADTVGSIEKGKRAELLILDADDYRHLAYEFGSNLIRAVFKGGSQVAGVPLC